MTSHISGTIVVTGGAGFIGKHTVRTLLESGAQNIAVIDNDSEAMEKMQQEYSDDGRIKFFTDDILNLVGQNSVFETIANPEIMIHLAAQVDVRKSMEDPFFDVQQNVLGSTAVLTSAKKFGIKHFIFASTGAVYGQVSHPAVENQQLQPESVYGLSKKNVEENIRLLCPGWKMDWTIFRFANVYGPGKKSSESGVISIFLDHMKKGEEIKIFGDGEQIRDYIFVNDIAKALATAALQTVTGTYNVSTCTETSLNQLVEIMSQLTNYTKTPTYLPAKEGDVIYSCLENKKAIDNLGLKPVSLMDGIKQSLV